MIRLVKPISVGVLPLPVCLFLLFLPAIAYCDVDYIWEDFEVDIQSLAVNWEPSDLSYSGPYIGNLSIRDGYLFLNLSQEKYSVGILGNAKLRTPADKLISFMGMDVRLRCSSDNQMESEVGGGSRVWGFALRKDQSLRGFSFLCFESFSADCDMGSPGLRALSMVNGEILYSKLIEGIDIRDWHNYTILWRRGNATFLVDGVNMAITTDVPDEDMGAAIWIDVDLMQHNDWIPQPITFPCEVQGSENLCTDEFVQIDYVRIFMEEDRFREMESDVSVLLSRTKELIEGLEQKGENTTQVRMDYSETRGNWLDNQYFYEKDYQLIEAIISALENWDDIILKFADANEAIQGLEQQGRREALMMKGYYGTAESAWAKYDYETTNMYLQRILDKAAEIAEFALLPILSFILLAAILCRK